MDKRQDTNTALAQKLQSAASALGHGRRATALEKVTEVYATLTEARAVIDGMTNELRAAWGERGVSHGNPDHDDNPEELSTSVGDTLANIMHFCVREEIDFATCLSVAEANFNAESSEGGH